MASEQLTIDTPEQIALEFPLAGVGSRFLALAVDTLIQIALMFALVVAWIAAQASVVLLLSGVGMTSAGIWTLALAVLALFVLFYGYFAIFEIAWQGQTPGKRMIGLRVIAASGRPMTAYQALLRNVLRLVDQLPGLYGIGIVFVLVTSRNQRLGDLAAGTVVIHERRPSGAFVAAPDPRDTEPVVRAGQLRTGRLTDQEIGLIERFLQRRADLEWDVRDRTAREIATRVRQRLGLTADGEDEDLLERVTAEYRTFGAYR